MNRHNPSGRTFRQAPIVAACFFLMVVFFCSMSPAMPPPEPGELEKLEREGKLAERIEYAESLGANRVNPRLVWNAEMKLRQALGLPISTMRPPPGRVGMPTTGTVKILVICIAFADYPYYNSTSTIDYRIFSDGEPGDYPYESLTNYYKRSSYNSLTIEGNVLGWYTTDYNREDVVSERALIKEAFQYYDAQGHDFTQYDNDGDGVIDYFMIIWTGPHTGWATDWWAHKTNFYNDDFFVDGKTLDVYSWNWEYQYSGSPTNEEYEPLVLIHETGHALGLPDYYDYDKNVGPVGGVGNVDMMDHNWGDHNAFSKFLLDWIEPTVYTTGTHTGVTLRATDEFNEAVIVMPEAVQGEEFGEYFIIQNRRKNNNDSDHPGEGLMIWHIMGELGESEYYFAYNNSTSEYKLIRLMEADGLEEIENTLVPYGGTTDMYDYYVSEHEFGPDTFPNNNRYGGITAGFTITDISNAGATMTFTINYDLTPPADIAWVYDGPADDVETATSGVSLSANWAASTDSESSINAYLYSVGTSPEAADIVAWTENATSTSVTRSDLALSDGTTYYFSVKARNGAYLTSSVASSDGVTVTFSDTTPPTAVSAVYDGNTDYSDIDFWGTSTVFSSSWEITKDDESGIASYWYSIGTSAGASDTVAWTDNGASTSFERQGLSLSHATTYYVSVKARNGEGLFSGVTNSDGAVVDTSAPSEPAFVFDGTGADIATTTFMSQLSANWGAASDAESGIDSYWYAIGTSTDSANVIGWIDAGNVTSVTRTDMVLTDMQTYYFLIKAENNAGLLSAPAFSNGQTFDMDKTPPNPVATVNDGTGADIDVVDSNTTLSANWSTASDPDSEIVAYWYTIGTATGSTDVLYWQDNNLDTSVTYTSSEKLHDQQRYYFSVRAENAAGLMSGTTSSDGQVVDYFDVDSVTQSGANSIDILFSRAVDSSTSAVNINNYNIGADLGTPASADLQADGKTVRLTTATNIPECLEFTIEMTGIRDNSGQALTPNASPADVSISGTLVTSDIDIETTWSKDYNPYCIMNDIIIEGNARLLISYGVSVKFKPAIDARILVYGGLTTLGMSGDHVVFTSAATSPVAGDWKSIIFDSSAWYSSLKYTEFRYADNPILIQGDDTNIEYNTFSNCSFACLMVTSGAPTIKNNTFSNCSQESDTNYCLKVSTTSEVDVKYNSFDSTNARGVSLFAPVNFIGNTVSNFSYLGLQVSTGGGESVIKSNNFSNNGVAIASWLPDHTVDATFNYLNGNTADSECNASGCNIYTSPSLPYPVDRLVQSSSLTYKTDNTFSTDLGNYTYPGASVYMEASATDSDSSNQNSMLAVNTSSSTDTDGIFSILIEKSDSPGTYRGSFYTGATSSQQLYRLGVLSGETVFSKLFFNISKSDQVIVQDDDTPPSDIATVYDGFWNDVATTTSKTQLRGSWTESTDDISGIAAYWYGIGKTAGATDVVGWTNNGSTRFVNQGGLTLSEGQTYYFTVKAQNGVGLFSNPSNSDGQTVTFSSSMQSPTVNTGWNLVGFSRKNVSFDPATAFSGAMYEVVSFASSTYTAITDQTSISAPFGGGLWVYADSDLEEVPMAGDAETADYSDIQLEEGWNIFSLPYETATTWNSSNAILNCGGEQALPAVYQYDDGAGYSAIQPGGGNMLAPWQGYFIKAPSASCYLRIVKQ